MRTDQAYGDLGWFPEIVELEFPKSAVRITPRNEQSDFHVDHFLSAAPEAIQAGLAGAEVQPCREGASGARSHALRLKSSIADSQIEIGPGGKTILEAISGMSGESLHRIRVIERRRARLGIPDTCR